MLYVFRLNTLHQFDTCETQQMKNTPELITPSNFLPQLGTLHHTGLYNFDSYTHRELTLELQTCKIDILHRWNENIRHIYTHTQWHIRTHM